MLGPGARFGEVRFGPIDRVAMSRPARAQSVPAGRKRRAYHEPAGCSRPGAARRRPDRCSRRRRPRCNTPRPPCCPGPRRRGRAGSAGRCGRRSGRVGQAEGLGEVLLGELGQPLGLEREAGLVQGLDLQLRVGPGLLERGDRLVVLAGGGQETAELELQVASSGWASARRRNSLELVGGELLLDLRELRLGVGVVRVLLDLPLPGVDGAAEAGELDVGVGGLEDRRPRARLEAPGQDLLGLVEPVVRLVEVGELEVRPTRSGPPRSPYQALLGGLDRALQLLGLGLGRRGRCRGRRALAVASMAALEARPGDRGAGREAR